LGSAAGRGSGAPDPAASDARPHARSVADTVAGPHAHRDAADQPATKPALAADRTAAPAGGLGRARRRRVTCRPDARCPRAGHPRRRDARRPGRRLVRSPWRLSLIR
ncbi:hypothetical protein, partial [Streptomyces alkaliterrae]|uniref:hypothetical protein n=1 Tax=Streptomyces alkaliterrae TaxID=2213162 RepID=UPI001E59277F